MVAHAREDLPNECCGMVGGARRRGDDGHPGREHGGAARCATRWTRRSSTTRCKAIEDDGGELLAIYHSHTKSAAYPSQTDVNQAVAWPEQIYLIVSLADDDSPDVKGYHLRDLKIADAELEIVT